MGLYAGKERFVRRLRGAEDRLVARGVRADTITLAALPAAAATAACLVAGAHLHAAWWLGVAPLSLLRMALNALDGAVARRAGTRHRRGALLNELVDRAADLVTLCAGYLVPVPAPLVTAAILGTLLVSFVAVAGEAVTGSRTHAGPMGKPDRALVLALSALGAVGVGPVALVAGFGTIACGAAATVVQRVRRVWLDAGPSDAGPCRA